MSDSSQACGGLWRILDIFNIYSMYPIYILTILNTYWIYIYTGCIQHPANLACYIHHPPPISCLQSLRHFTFFGLTSLGHWMWLYKFQTCSHNRGHLAGGGCISAGNLACRISTPPPISCLQSLRHFKFVGLTSLGHWMWLYTFQTCSHNRGHLAGGGLYSGRQFSLPYYNPPTYFLFAKS